MLQETRRGTPICIIIFTRYITPVIRLSARRRTCTVFNVKSLRARARARTSCVHGLSHACEVFSRGEGSAARESRGTTRLQLYEAFSVPDLCLREALLSLHPRRATSFRRRGIAGGGGGGSQVRSSVCGRKNARGDRGGCYLLRNIT